jgi:hypothetical protein
MLKFSFFQAVIRLYELREESPSCTVNKICHKRSCELKIMGKLTGRNPK